MDAEQTGRPPAADDGALVSTDGNDQVFELQVGHFVAKCLAVKC